MAIIADNKYMYDHDVNICGTAIQELHLFCVASNNKLIHHMHGCHISQPDRDVIDHYMANKGEHFLSYFMQYNTVLPHPTQKECWLCSTTKGMWFSR